MTTFASKVFLLIEWFPSDIVRKELICAGVAAVRTARTLCPVHEFRTTRETLLAHSKNPVDVAYRLGSLRYHYCEVSCGHELHGSDEPAWNASARREGAANIRMHDRQHRHGIQSYQRTDYRIPRFIQNPPSSTLTTLQ